MASKKTKINWRKAALALARCVVADIQSGGRLGMGTGLVFSKRDDGSSVVQRWDVEHIAALRYIGIEFEDAPKKRKAKAAAK